MLRRLSLAPALCAAVLFAFATTSSAQTNAQVGRRPNEVAAPPETVNRTAPSPGRTTDPVRHPRFKIELRTITAVDETGPDFAGSDEIFATIDTPSYRAMTRTFGDTDSGDVITVARCIWPAEETDTQLNGRWRCAQGGGSGNISFSISLYEHDGYSPINPGFCIPGGDDVEEPGTEFCPMRTARRLFTIPYTHTEAGLTQRLTAPGQSFDVEDGYTQHGFTGFEYLFVYRVTRLPDFIEERPRVLQR